MIYIETARLCLRDWQDTDTEAFIQMNQNPLVMEFFPKCLTREESLEFINRQKANLMRDGFGFWATEIKATGEFIGFISLSRPSFAAHFTPCIEIGWRLAAKHWGQGYATEGAETALKYGFKKCGLEEIVAFTVPANLRSKRVMEKIGMTHNPQDDFLHPALSKDHPLAKHVLYHCKK